jgi:hypothetical protein
MDIGLIVDCLASICIVRMGVNIGVVQLDAMYTLNITGRKSSASPIDRPCFTVFHYEGYFRLIFKSFVQYSQTSARFPVKLKQKPFECVVRLTRLEARYFRV